MPSQRTMLESYISDEFVFTIEKWWTPTKDSEMEAHIGVGLSHFVPGAEKDAHIVLLSLDRAEALANKILEVVRKSR